MTVIYYDGASLSSDCTVMVKSNASQMVKPILDINPKVKDVIRKFNDKKFNILLSESFFGMPRRTTGTKMAMHRRTVYCGDDRIYASATTGDLIANELYKSLPKNGNYLDAADEIVKKFSELSYDECSDDLCQTCTTIAVGEKYVHVINIKLPFYDNDGEIMRFPYATHTKFAKSTPISTNYGTSIDCNDLVMNTKNPIDVVTWMHLHRDIGTSYDEFEVWTPGKGVTKIKTTADKADKASATIPFRVLKFIRQYDSIVKLSKSADTMNTMLKDPVFDVLKSDN